MKNTGAIVPEADLQKVLRLKNYGFKLKVTPTKSGSYYVLITGVPNENQADQTAAG